MPKRDPVNFHLDQQNAVSDDCNHARELFNKSRYGALKENKLVISLLEALYLLSKEKIVVLDKRGKEIDFETLFRKAKKYEPDIKIRYPVFKDLRERGYVVKTALKFGADFRVYDRGIKPGEDHARWVVYAVYESDKQTWFEFSSKSRVAHSTRKNLLIGVVDAEEDVTYYEVSWVRP